MSVNSKSIKDIIEFYIYFFVAILAVYKLPQILSTIIQIIFLWKFYKSDKDYFWLALVFVIESAPGNLFSKYTPLFTFSIVRNSPFGTLYFSIVFLILSIIKAKNYKIKTNFFLKKNFLVLLIYFMMLLLVFGIYKIVFLIRMILPWSLLFILPRFLKNEKEYACFFKLIFNFVPFVIFTQLIKIILGFDFSYFLGGTLNPAIKAKSIYEFGQAVRPWDGMHIPFLALLGAMVFMSIKSKYYSRNYLRLILILSLLSITLSATRSWFFSSLFMISIFYIVINKIKLSEITSFIVLIFLTSILIIEIPGLKLQFDYAFNRFNSVELLAKGEITPGDASPRFRGLDKYMLRKFEESPIVGWGYGSLGYKYSNGHLGYHNILVQTGLLGFILFFSLIYIFCVKLYFRYKILSRFNPYKNSLLIFIIFLFGILIINATVQWFNYFVPFEIGFVISFLFIFANFMYNKSLGYQSIIK